MSYTSLLINTCIVERYTEGAADAYGNPVKMWADHLVDEPCRWQDTTGTELVIDAEVVVADDKLFLGDVDITEQDRVVIGAVTYEIILVTDKQDGLSSHHKECYLRTVR